MSDGRGRASRSAWLVAAGAVAAAVLSARPYAGGWYDGACLATVESLADYGTPAIESSIYVDPSRTAPGAPRPYGSDSPAANRDGTMDKLWIGGRYYSSRPPVPGVLLAGLYQGLRWLGLPPARQRPDLFAYAMTLLSSGLAYVAAVSGIHALARRLLGAPGRALGVTASFALGTLSLTYARHVNYHAVLLGVAVGLVLMLHRLAERLERGERPWAWALGAGVLAGFGYTLDLGTGPALLLAAGLLVAYRGRRAGRGGPAVAGAFAVGVVPWLVMHHGLNHALAGVWGPASSVPAFSAWPGSPFAAGGLTGVWGHPSVWRCCVYGLELALGVPGFLWHNPTMPAALVSGIGLLWVGWRRPSPGRIVSDDSVSRQESGRNRARLRRPEVCFALAWPVLTWVVYTVGSNNHSGRAASIRWFVPTLAAGYYLLILALRQWPRRYGQFLAWAACGVAISAVHWVGGPWAPWPHGRHLWLWVILGVGAATWAAVLAARVTCPRALPPRAASPD